MFSWQRRIRKALLILSLISSTSALDLWPFPPKRFKGNALLEAGSLALGNDERAIAFGDFNGDQFLDIVTLDSGARKVTVHIWDHQSFIFRDAASFTHSEQIYNVVPGDFTHDGTLDLLVMSRGSSPSEIKMALYVGSPGRGFESSPISVPSSNAAQPIPLDANGDLSIDLLGIRPGSSSLSIWNNVFNGSDPNTSVFSVTDAPFNGATCSISNPHSNAVVDLDGDCLADVFLVCDDGTGSQSFQIWRNDKNDGFTLAQTGRLPSGLQAISFADIDRDGTIDMVFTTCSSVSPSTGIGSGCDIHIAYNKQLPLCTSPTTSGLRNGKKICRQPDQLCAADPDFQFDLSERDGNDGYVKFPVTDLYPSSSLLVRDTRPSPPVPIPIHLGDANLDGFPDLLFITTTDPHGGFLGIGETSERTPRLALSMPCAKGIAGCDTNGRGRVGWKVVKKEAGPMNRVLDATGVSFLDVDEDGTLDILVQRTGEQGQGPFLFVQNNFFFDAFFLKAIVLNGACDNGWCSGRNGSGRYHPFGVSYSGASYKYTILDTTGRRSAAQVAQLPQTAYQSLLTPYSFFGLGRTNNYIENLFVGSTKKNTSHFVNMEGVIPNSKVVIYPPASDDGSWRRELYLRPGAWIPWVTLTVVVTVIVLACVVFALHLNEKRADELERRRASHHINFDAL
ncbi:uncharacterized protein FOMMEDRAFT_139451, partial [Fomitiporia mediterranea MF3/22]|uniref:uncharacterized protein n=1 Tax=Fomitiporia mediterranea (strain MF3/22) TaxID=694068 RepID=UPI00044091B2